MHLISLGYTLLALTMTFFFQVSDFAFAQQAGPVLPARVRGLGWSRQH